MSCGIYKLSFNGTDKVYIGQSNNIQNRYRQHITRMSNGQASVLLQEAYLKYGKPSIEVILDCNEDELDECENEVIAIFNSVENGFNTLAKAGDIPRRVGEDHGRALYSNDTVEDALFALLSNPLVSIAKIADMVGISKENLYLIANGTNHRWLETKFPKEYANMLELSGTRRATSQSASNRGVVYPLLKSPEGQVFKIENIKAFAREHGLDNGHVGKVLHGKYKSHKGWKLA